MLLIPVTALMGTVALLILKKIKSNSVFKKALKLLILLGFIVAFVVIAYYMSASKGY
jgi:hypothetical protein